MFRYFRIAEFLEKCTKFVIKTKDSYSRILDPKGYDNSTIRIIKDDEYFDESIYIPFNPFYLIPEDKEVWMNVYPDDFSGIEENRGSIMKHLRLIWKRIHEIKWWLGISEDTRFCGIREEGRLTTVLENFIKTGIKEFRYDFEHAVFRNINKDIIKKFINLMKNRRRKKGFISLVK